MKKALITTLSIILCICILTSCSVAKEIAQEVISQVSNDSDSSSLDMEKYTDNEVAGGYYDYISWYDKNDRESINFDNIVYERPDIDELLTEIDTANTAIENASTQDERDNVYLRLYDIYYDYMTIATYTQIMTSIDGTDEYWLAEDEFVSNNFYTVQEAISQAEETYFNISYPGETEEQTKGIIDETENMDDDAIDEYYDLFAEVNNLTSQYFALTLNPTVEFNGQQVSLSEAAYDDQYSYEDYMQMLSDYYTTTNPQACEIYIKLIEVRNKIAQLEGYNSYEEYAYAYSGTDYSPEDIKQYREHVKKYFADGYIDVYSTSFGSLTQEFTTDQAFEALQSVCENSPTMTEAYNYMKENNLYNVEGSKNKVAGAFEMYLYAYDSPFIVVNSDDTLAGATDIAHEFGHFYDDYVNWTSMRDVTECTDTSEIFSQAMEYMVLYNMPKFVDGDVADELTAYMYKQNYQTFVEQTYYNELESVLYNTEDLTVEKVNEIAGSLAEEYGLTENAEESLDNLSWIDISHLFDLPFYTISYCTSLDVAMQINSIITEKGFSAGLEKYEELIQRGDDGGFLSNIERVGLESPFSEERVKDAASTILPELVEYEAAA